MNMKQQSEIMLGEVWPLFETQWSSYECVIIVANAHLVLWSNFNNMLSFQYFTMINLIWPEEK